MRHFNRRVDDRQFDETTKRRVWEKARPISGKPEQAIRRDRCGSEIHWHLYGNTDSQYGWEIDHIKPVAKGGSDAIDNLQPLQWATNREKGDTYPWNCDQIR